MQTIESAIASFLRVNRAKSPATRSTYATGLNAFCKYLHDQQIDPARSGLDDLPERSLEQFYLWLVDRHGRDHLSTVETYLAGLRGLLRYLASEAAVPQISLERSREQLQRVKVRKNYSTPRVDSTLALIVHNANQTPLPDRDPTGKLGLRLLRDRAILNTLYATGMRRAEVASLDRADLASGRVGEAIISGKGNKERVVFFDPQTLGHIDAYLDRRADHFEPLFIRHTKGSRPGPRGERLRLSPQTIWLTVKRHAQSCGVSASTHHFRHLKATTLLDRGADLSQVQDLLGHASPETTKTIYAHYSVGHLRAAFDRYSQPLEDAVAARPGQPQDRD